MYNLQIKETKTHTVSGRAIFPSKSWNEFDQMAELLDFHWVVIYIYSDAKVVSSLVDICV